MTMFFTYDAVDGHTSYRLSFDGTGCVLHRFYDDDLSKGVQIEPDAVSWLAKVTRQIEDIKDRLGNEALPDEADLDGDLLELFKRVWAKWEKLERLTASFVTLAQLERIMMQRDEEEKTRGCTYTWDFEDLR